ncbi:MAG TPA: carbohydrate porin [Candidatus Acidoferrales bacterium]|nr:carbohydrate porin [Candidatus Acidoferrales bacterium]
MKSILLTALLPATMLAAPATTPAPSPTRAPQSWSVHAQSTVTQQYHQGFPAAYSGPQSLYNQPDYARTFDITLYLGARLWRGAAVYVNPELDEGFGLGNPGANGQPYNGTFGVAGFVSGEAYKVGSGPSYTRVQRAFIRQTFNIGGSVQPVKPDINQLGGSVTTRNLTLTAGKFAVTDVFDNNPYAHDPRNDFLNWSIIDMGSFDYAADAWGYTYGISAELNGDTSALRLGIFQLSKVPNNTAIEPQPLAQYSPILEYEKRTSLFGGHPGAIKALIYYDDGYFGPYAQALDAARGTGHVPSTADVRSKHLKAGGGVNIAQEIAPHVGVFARVSAMNGTYEADEFTDIDRSLSFGASVDGGLYGRPNDAAGVGFAFNAISGPAQEYFAAGGLGVLVGDGGLTYGGERIEELYYKLGITRYGAITADYQHVSNPAYNTVRGPVSIFGLRYRAAI